MSGLDIEGVLLAHVPLGDDAEGIEQCSCGVLAVWRRDDLDDDVRYLPSHAEGPDLRWHAAHVAAVLREQIAAWLGSEEVMALVCTVAPFGPDAPAAHDILSALAALVAPSRVPGEET